MNTLPKTRSYTPVGSVFASKHLTRELALVDDVTAKTKAVEVKAKSNPGQKAVKREQKTIRKLAPIHDSENLRFRSYRVSRFRNSPDSETGRFRNYRVSRIRN